MKRMSLKELQAIVSKERPGYEIVPSPVVANIREYVTVSTAPDIDYLKKKFLKPKIVVYGDRGQIIGEQG